MKHFTKFIFSAIILSITIGCSNGAEGSNYSAPSQEEIEQMIEKKNIEPLAIETTGGVTFILCKSSLYTITKSNGEITENYSSWSGDGQGKISTGMTSTGSAPHAFVIINDKHLIQNAETVEVVFNDGKTVSKLVKDKRGFIMFYNRNEKDMNLKADWKVNIYGQNGNVLYESAE
ncbi:hypothetical protein [Salibacterium lacus]|uniref:Lipoprotein n=1 Tax=Salibacterium lacus TaxID=1898109 RepID=A0ABW5T3J0_9BACI